MSNSKNIFSLKEAFLFRAIIGGVFVGLSLNYEISFLASFGVAFLWSVSEKPKYAGLWGLIAVLMTHKWLLALHPLTWVGIKSSISEPLVTLIWIICGLIGYILVFTWAWMQTLFLCRFNKRENLLGVISLSPALFFSGLWGLAEVTLSQSPLFWIGLGASFLPGDRLLASWAEWIGAGGLASLQLMIGWWIFTLFREIKQRKSLKKIFLFGTIILIFLHLIGLFNLEETQTISSGKLAVWQTNIPIRKKFNKAGLNKIPQDINLNLDQASQFGADLLLVPEGTLQINQHLIYPPKIDLISGGFRSLEGKIRNSILIFNKGEIDFSSHVDKYRIVPLGEWIPSFLRFRKIGLSALGGIESGSKSRIFEWKGISGVAAICYEIADGKLIADSVREGGVWILSIANLDPYPLLLQKQFINLAKLRSIENSRPVITVGNTGPTSQISKTGKVEKLLKPSVEKLGIFDLKISKDKTVYSRFGEIPIICLLFITFILTLVKREII